MLTTVKTSNKYSLEVISREPSSEGKLFKKHNMDGLDTIGVYENEPFKIKFRNLTSRKVQVKISVDGTDILTGDLASTSLDDGQMWVVQAYGSLELKAWPEDYNGGAEFLFGKTEYSVAANTHGNLSAKGLIAAAVFEEGEPDYCQPTPIPIPIPYPVPQPCQPPRAPWDITWMDKSICQTGGGGTYSSSALPVYSNSAGESKRYADNLNYANAGPAVGAGDYVSQHIGKTAGIRKAVFAGVVQVKYEWWTSLKSKLRTKSKAEPPFKAFPGDCGKLIDLGDTPRLETPHSRKTRIRKAAIEKRTRAKNRKRLRPEEKYAEYDRFA